MVPKILQDHGDIKSNTQDGTEAASSQQLEGCDIESKLQYRIKDWEQNGEVSSFDYHSRWYKALLEEDCLEVMALLRNKPGLVMAGWKPDVSLEVKGSWPNYWMPVEVSKWKGRTALHVGARRGCVELIQQVFRLFEVQDFSEKETTGDSDAEPAASMLDKNSDPDFNFDPNYQLEADDTTRSAQAEIDRIRMARKEITHNLQESQHYAEPEGGCQQSITVGQEIPESNLQTDADLANSAHSTVENEGHLSVKYFDEGAVNKDGRDNHLDASAVSVKSFGEFYNLKDGRYNLDAFAMAVLNGNFDVIRLLAGACLHAKNEGQTYLIDSLKPSVSGFDEENLSKWKAAAQMEEKQRTEKVEKNRTLLKKVTKETLAGFNSTMSDSELLKRACSKHRDFNFLPQDEFMFHYLVTVPTEKWAEDIGQDTLRVQSVLMVLWESVKSVKSEHEDVDLWKFLLQLQDGQGRTPSHAALDEGRYRLNRLRHTLGMYSEEWEFVVKEVVDGAGRTLLHRALALNQWEVVQTMLRDDPSWDAMVSTSGEKYRHSAPIDLLKRSGLVLDVDDLSLKNGFDGMKMYKEITKYVLYQEFLSNETRKRYIAVDDEWTKDWSNWIAVGPANKRISPIKLSAIMRGAFAFSVPLYSVLLPQNMRKLQDSFQSMMRLLWEKQEEEKGKDTTFVKRRTEKKGLLLNPYPVEIRNKKKRVIMAPKGFGPAEFAVLLGDVESATKVFESMKDIMETKKTGYAEKMQISTIQFTNDVNAFHLAAASGNYEMLKLCIDNCDLFLNNDVFGKDFEGNTPLHYALQGRPPLCSHLLDYVNCQHILKQDQRIKTKKNLDEDLVRRKGCINLLLQIGCDMFKTNKFGEIPYPSGLLKSDQKLLDWWYDKQITEFDSIKAALGTAANAISVTATLVATASYVGPLQPPLGYGGAHDDLQVEIIWVKMFIVCDTLSFYLAVCAIICSLIPSLPVPQQAMRDELRRTQNMVSLAVAILFPSVVLVLLAFVASSIAVISSNPSSLGGSLTFSTTAVGTSLFTIIALLFCIRFFIIVLPGNSWMKYIYKRTSF